MLWSDNWPETFTVRWLGRKVEVSVCSCLTSIYKHNLSSKCLLVVFGPLLSLQVTDHFPICLIHVDKLLYDDNSVFFLVWWLCVLLCLLSAFLIRRTFFGLSFLRMIQWNKYTIENFRFWHTYPLSRYERSRTPISFLNGRSSESPWRDPLSWHDK